MSFPPPALTAIRHAIADALELSGTENVVVAVSGGADSMALAVGGAWAARRSGQRLTAVTVDHGLREDSANEAELVASRVAALGIKSTIVRVDAAATRAAAGPEAAARQARYDALAHVAAQLGAPILTGHHLNDQAETVLLGLARGSGGTSLSGMRPHSTVPGHPEISLIRPFLHLTRNELREAATAAGVDWVEDPTNELKSTWQTVDGRPLARARVRHVVLPILESELGPGIAASLARTAKILQSDADALGQWASTVQAECVESHVGTVVVQTRTLADYPESIRRRVLKNVAEEAGVSPGVLTYAHIEALDRLVMTRAGGLALDLPGVRAEKISHTLTLRRTRGL